MYWTFIPVIENTGYFTYQIYMCYMYVLMPIANVESKQSTREPVVEKYKLSLNK